MVKTIILIPFLIINFQIIFGQKSAIELINNRFIEYNIENRVQIVLEETACDSIIITSEAEIKRESDCLWLIKPSKLYHRPGLAINIFKIKNTDTIFIERKYLMVRTLKTMTPQISQWKNLDSVEIAQINMENGIYAFNSEWDKTGCYSSGVKQFNCLLIRDEKVIGYTRNIGAKFNDETKMLFNQLHSNDQIHFINIIIDSPIRKDEQLSSIKLTIK